MPSNPPRRKGRTTSQGVAPPPIFGKNWLKEAQEETPSFSYKQA